MLLCTAVMALALLPVQEPATPEPAAAQAPAEHPAAMTPLASGDASGAISAGLAAYHRRQFQRAASSFEKALAADPQNAAAAWYLAYTYYKIAEPRRPFDPGKQKAAQMFAKAYALDPNFKPDWRAR